MIPKGSHQQFLKSLQMDVIFIIHYCNMVFHIVGFRDVQTVVQTLWIFSDPHNFPEPHFHM